MIRINNRIKQLIKPIKWHRATEKELEEIKNGKQIVSNCYDISVRNALLSSTKGKELFRKRIWFSNDSKNKNCKISFNINGENKNYSTRLLRPLKNIEKMIYNIVSKMILSNPSEKPFVSRLARFGLSLPCEFNKPSNAFKWYTGLTPLAIGEDGLNFTLKKYKKETTNLLEKLSKTDNKDFSFIALSGLKRKEYTGWKKFHCLPIINVDCKEKTVKLLDKRTNKIHILTFDDFIKNFKAIVGIIFE